MRRVLLCAVVGLTWLLGACDSAYDGGDASASTDTVSTQQAVRGEGAAAETVVLCHKPGTPAEKTLTLPVSAKAGHLGHGDTLGACGEPTTCGPRPLPPEPPATDLPVDEDESAWDSEAVAAIEGASPTAFNPAGQPVDFKLSCPTLAMTPDSVVVYLNNQPVPFSELLLAPDRITLLTGLPSGRNELVLLANDIYGFTIHQRATLWAGSFGVPVRVLDPAGNPAPGVSVTARLADDPEVSATLVTDALGQGLFSSLPNRSYNVVATAAGNLLATRPTSVFDGTVVLRLQGIAPPSPIDNNDFSLGLDGWELGNAPVFLIEHIEGPMGFSQPVAASLPAERASRAELSPQVHGLPVPFTSIEALAEDNDLVLATSGEGQQSISRSFEVEEGVKSVTVRYRFLTTEVPGGWFGSEFNDFYNVSVRTANGGGAINDGNSMNGLGLGAFDGAGATSWREAELQVAEGGDTVQVNLAVANVADAFLPSYVIVDVVKKKKLAITALRLNDIDNQALQFLSASTHPYFSGNTRVHGTITVEGDKEDSLRELKLEVLQGGSVIATGTLASGLTGTLYRQFGDTERIQLQTSQFFFEIPSAQLAGANQDTNGNLTLRVKARSNTNETAERDAGNVQKLTRVTGVQRYGTRDEAQGGDDWAKPRVRTFIEGTAHTWGDFSNMNGGRFPPHATHQTGNSADGWFNGYNQRNAATAASIIGHLNEHGTRIRTVYVTFTPTSAFATAISNVTLNDGRAATAVIRNVGGHGTHFHWEVTD